MESTTLKAVTAPPSLMKSLMAGFDVVSNHLGLILFSVLLDILLWFGPHVRFARIFAPVFEQAAEFPEMQAPGSLSVLQESVDKINLLGVLRTFPIGVPSLLANQSPQQSPLQRLGALELQSFLNLAGFWFLFMLVGVALGTLYFSLVAQASIQRELNFSLAVRNWPRHFGQVLLLTLFWYILIALFMVPLSCLLSFMLLLGFGFAQFPLLIALFFGAMIVWLLIPLFFSPHGIFTHGRKMWDSILQGIRLSRATFGTTGLLILSVVVLSEGLDVVWKLPADNSWFLLVGIVGHAFVTAALLAATFVYYHDADLWLRELVRQRELVRT